MLDIILQGAQVKLLAERALYWPAQETLIVADLHWGKSAHFRKHGIAIPGTTQTQDEVRLAGIIRQYNVSRLIVAGDLFHSQDNEEVKLFTHWRNSHSQLHIDFIPGNHDTFATTRYLEWNMQLHPEGMDIGAFFIAHDVPETCTQFCIHGHVHPAIRISRRGHNSIRLDCFAEDTQRFILPAFGQFTGNHTLEPTDYKHIYVVAGSEVMKWK